ncbi:MAG: glucose-1-phosphate adenylyltransferase, partial [Eubacterium sp.]|nr:glucose-1-phosphate adenylyltransferase [Eubacterium sp.]
VDRCIIGPGAEIYGEVSNSVIGAGVRIGKGAVVRDSIIMRHTSIGEGSEVYKSIIAENVKIGSGVKIGIGEEAPNVLKPSVYGWGIATIGEDSVIPDGVWIGKNTVLSGETVYSDYKDGGLEAGGALIKKEGGAV